MTYKKTWLSYLLWALYTCLTGVMLANYAILFWQKKINDAVSYGTALFVLFVFMAAAGCYFLLRRLFDSIGRKCEISAHTKSLWEIFIVLSLFFAGLLYRVAFCFRNSSGITETSYYQLATVKTEEIAEPIVHGASYLYTMCLSFAFSFLGNKIIVGILLQILIQMVTILLAFFVVRRMAGRIPACITMLVLSVSSVYVEQILTMTPESLFFALYLMGIFLVGGYVKNDCSGRSRKPSAVWGALLSGFTIGFLAYLDAVAFTLVIFLFGLMTGVRASEPKRKRRGNDAGRRSAGFSMLLILTAIVAGALSFAGMLALNAYSYYTEIGTMAETLLTFYRTNFRTDYVLYHTEYSVVECLILVFLAAFLILAFWNRRKVQNVSPWLCLILLLAPTPLTAKGALPYQVYSIFLWSVLAGIGVQQSFVWESAAAVKERCTEEGTEPVKASSVETSMTPVLVNEPSAEAISVPVEMPAGKPRFLENPLPLPRKHEKRTLDYQYEVAEAQMKFDIEIAENDDFDIG